MNTSHKLNLDSHSRSGLGLGEMNRRLDWILNGALFIVFFIPTYLGFRSFNHAFPASSITAEARDLPDELWQGYDGPAYEIKPPATAEELAQFRIVTNQQGTFAIQQLRSGNWEQRPNTWNDLKGCRWDMNWWITHEVRPNAHPVTNVWNVYTNKLK